MIHWNIVMVPFLCLSFTINDLNCLIYGFKKGLIMQVLP